MNYTLRKIASPLDRTKASWYCVAETSGMVGIREIANRISKSCTLTSVDIVACLEGFLQYLPEYLINGFSVKLSDFGIIKLSIQSKGHDLQEQCSTDDIKSVHVRFLPGSLLKTAIKQDMTYSFDKESVPDHE